MTPRQKLKIRFKIFSSIIFIGLIVLLFIYKSTPQIITEELFEDCLSLSSIIICLWFWYDEKLLYFRNQLIISLLLCLMYLIVVIKVPNFTVLAPVPLASVIGRVFANKMLDKIRKIDLDAKDKDESWVEMQQSRMIMYIITAVITGIIHLIIYIGSCILNMFGICPHN
jgi:hypothetical protein